MLNIISIQVIDSTENPSAKCFAIYVDQDLLGDWHVKTCTKRFRHFRGLWRYYYAENETTAQNQVRDLLLKKLQGTRETHPYVTEIDAYDHINVLHWVPTDQLPLSRFA